MPTARILSAATLFVGIILLNGCQDAKLPAQWASSLAVLEMAEESRCEEAIHSLREMSRDEWDQIQYETVLFAASLCLSKSSPVSHVVLVRDVAKQGREKYHDAWEIRALEKMALDRVEGPALNGLTDPATHSPEAPIPSALETAIARQRLAEAERNLLVTNRAAELLAFSKCEEAINYLAKNPSIDGLYYDWLTDAYLDCWRAKKNAWYWWQAYLIASEGLDRYPDRIYLRAKLGELWDYANHPTQAVTHYEKATEAGRNRLPTITDDTERENLRRQLRRLEERLQILRSSNTGQNSNR